MYCISLNDSFEMNAWADKEKIKYCQMIPDESGEFSRLMGMLM